MIKMIKLKTLLLEQYRPEFEETTDTRYKSDAVIAAEKKAELEKAKRELEELEQKRKQLEREKAEADRLEKEELEKEIQKNKELEAKKKKDNEDLENEIGTERDIWRKKKDIELKKKKELEDKKKKELEDKKKKEKVVKHKYESNTTYRSKNGTGSLYIGPNVEYAPGVATKITQLFYAELQETFPNKRMRSKSAYRDEYNQSRVVYNRYKKYGYYKAIGKIYSKSNEDIKRSMQRAFIAGNTNSESIKNGEKVLQWYRSKGRHMSRHQFGASVDISMDADIIKWLKSGKSKYVKRYLAEGAPPHIHCRFQKNLVPQKFPPGTYYIPRSHPFPRN